MSALALARLGIRPEDFGKMCYGYFVLLAREMEDLEIQHHLPAAAVQATLCNLKRDPDKSRAFTPWDFMPGWRWKEEETRKATREELRAFFGAVSPEEAQKREQWQAKKPK